MLERSIDTSGYDLDVAGLFMRRLTQSGVYPDFAQEDNLIRLTLQDDTELDGVATALALLLCRDLMHLELAAITDRQPLTLTQKQAVLTEAVRIARTGEQLGGVRRVIRDYLSEDGPTLHLNGFLRFRLPDTIAAWRRAAEQAAEELQLQQEYLELMGVLRAFVQIQPSQLGEISLCLNPDGSYTITDESDARVEYTACSPERIVSILVGLAPARLTVYDLSGGQREPLNEALSRVFAGRVRFFR